MQLDAGLMLLIGTTIAAILAAVYGSRRPGRVSLQALPWRTIRRLGYELRSRFFSGDKPPASNLWHVNDDLDTVRRRLGSHSYELDWPFSYQYKGEDINARRYYYAPSRDLPHRQLHIRAWETDDGVDLHAHEEASALHHPKPHLKGDSLSLANGWLKATWDAHDLLLDPLLYYERQRERAD